MFLRQLKLRNWKAFEDARFDFPRPDKKKNVILIGGRNGFGKTSLFEAIALGIFGREGIGLIGRAAAAADEERKALSYRDFMQRALNARAAGKGTLSCHIALTFEDSQGEPLVLERTWYFNEAGNLKLGESGEQIRILVGQGRKPAAPSANEIDRDAWYRDYLNRSFLPSHLANFFLFDGEQASAYAERDMAQQVREGIEGLLGLSWLRKLSEALRDFSDTRLSQLPKGVTGETIDRLQHEIREEEQAIRDAEAKLKTLDADFAEADRERTALTREVMGYAGGGTQAQKQELADERHRETSNYRNAEERLLAIVEKDLPFALVGQPLREQVEQRLRSEAALGAWLSAKAQGEPRMAEVIETVDARISKIRPPLDPEQKVGIEQALREALGLLWNPAPGDAAPDERHSHLGSADRERVILRLADAASVSSDRIQGLFDAMARASSAKRRLDEEIEALSLTTPQLEAKRQRLLQLDALIGEIDRGRGEKKAFASTRSKLVDDKRQDLARRTAQLDQSQKPAKLARRAQEVAAMLDDLVAEAWPLQIESVAKEMTSAIQDMAHRKDYLHRVSIDPDGEVKLLSKDGRNLGEFNLAAGEKQIFTQALFAAVAKVSGVEFPLIIDTPLGRLDEEHRINVLRNVAGRPGQVILLSTDTEVVGPYLEALRPKLAKTYRLENRRDGDLGISWPVEGYFQSQDVTA